MVTLGNKEKKLSGLLVSGVEKSSDTQAEWEKFFGSGSSADGTPLLGAGSQPEATWSVECFQLHCCCLPRALMRGPGQAG